MIYCLILLELYFITKNKRPRASSRGFAALRLPFGLPFGREHFVVVCQRLCENNLFRDCARMCGISF